LIRMSRWIAVQPFSASYWAFTFGATALAGATIRLAHGDREGAMTTLAPVLFIAANVLVLAIAAASIRLIARHQFVAQVATPVATASAPSAPERA
jgi:tellurite resistance protein